MEIAKARQKVVAIRILCVTDDRDEWNNRIVIISLLNEPATLTQTRSITSCYVAVFLEITESWNMYGAVPQHGKEFSSTRDCQPCRKESFQTAEQTHQKVQEFKSQGCQFERLSSEI